MCRAHACERLRKGRLHLRGVLGRAGADPASGSAARIGADVVQSEIGSFYVPVRSEPALLPATAIPTSSDCATSAAPGSPIGSPMSGTFTAIGGSTNKIVWQHKTPYRVGQGAGRRPLPAPCLPRRADGNFLAIDAKTGQELWRFQTGFGADAPPAVYEVNGRSMSRSRPAATSRSSVRTAMRCGCFR